MNSILILSAALAAYPLLSFFLYHLFSFLVKNKKKSSKAAAQWLSKYFRISSIAAPLLIYTLWNRSDFRVPILQSVILNSDLLKNLLLSHQSIFYFLVTVVGILLLCVIHVLGSVVPLYCTVKKLSQFKPPFLRFALVNSFFQIGIFSLNLVSEFVMLFVPVLIEQGWVSPVLATPLIVLLLLVVYVLFHQYYPGLLSRFYGFKKVEDPTIQAMVARLSLRSGVKLRSLRILNGSSLKVANGWAYGLFSHHICLTDNLIQRVSADELEAVLAHELGHVKQRHILISLFSIALVLIVSGIISLGVQLLFDYFGLSFSPYFFEIASTFVMIIVMLKITRFNEYRADRFSADATGNPKALISALRKLTGRQKKHSAFQKFFLPFFGLFRTHPSVAQRAASLAKWGGNRPFYPDQLMKRLVQYPLLQNKSVLAFSGGADSSFLAAAAAQQKRDLMLMTCVTPYIPTWEVEESRKIAKEVGLEQIELKFSFPEFLRDNPPQRCYLCKSFLFAEMKKKSQTLGIDTLFDGTNYEDLTAYRPGLKALKELGVHSPLAECGFSKKEIHYCSEKMGLSTAHKAPFACLLTRFPHHFEIKEEELRIVEKAECFLISKGFSLVRVRVLCRIEEGEAQGLLSASIELDPKKASRMSQSRVHQLIEGVLDCGFGKVSLNREGYRTGRMDLV